MCPTQTIAPDPTSAYGSAPQMNPLNPLAEMVRKRVAVLKERGITQTMIAVRAGKGAAAQSMISAVSKGLRRFMVDDLEKWADGFEFTGAERAEFLRLGSEASYLLVNSEATAGENGTGLKIWRELLSLRAEVFATRSQLLRSQSELADANGRVAALEKQIDLLLQRRKPGPKRGDTEG